MASAFEFNPAVFRTDRFREDKGIYISSDVNITVHGTNAVPSSTGKTEETHILIAKRHSHMILNKKLMFDIRVD